MENNGIFKELYDLAEKDVQEEMLAYMENIKRDATQAATQAATVAERQRAIANIISASSEMFSDKDGLFNYLKKMNYSAEEVEAVLSEHPEIRPDYC